jgi:hypothetical protein
MGNHYHLLVETARATLSRGMHSLNARYSQYFNLRHERAGHVFEGRFKAIIVQKQAHLLELHRYIVLNPVRAGIVPRPGDWPWSNYRATSGAVAYPGWLDVGSTLALFSSFGSGATGAYVRFVADGMRQPGSPLDHVRRQIYLGDRRFLEEMSERTKKGPSSGDIPASHRSPLVFEVDDIRKLVCSEWRVEPDDLTGREAGDAKLAAIYLSRKLCGKSAREIGDAYGIKRGRVTNVMVEIQRKRRTYLRRRLEKLISDLESNHAGK